MGSKTDLNEDSSREPVAGSQEEPNGKAKAKPSAEQPGKVPEGLAARRAKLENTKAYRDLQVELANRVCEHCGQKGPWEVVSSPKQVEGEKKVRFLRCFACGHQTKMASDK